MVQWPAIRMHLCGILGLESHIWVAFEESARSHEVTVTMNIESANTDHHHLIIDAPYLERVYYIIDLHSSKPFSLTHELQCVQRRWEKNKKIGRCPTTPLTDADLTFLNTNAQFPFRPPVRVRSPVRATPFRSPFRATPFRASPSITPPDRTLVSITPPTQKMPTPKTTYKSRSKSASRSKSRSHTPPSPPASPPSSFDIKDIEPEELTLRFPVRYVRTKFVELQKFFIDKYNTFAEIFANRDSDIPVIFPGKVQIFTQDADTDERIRSLVTVAFDELSFPQCYWIVYKHHIQEHNKAHKRVIQQLAYHSFLMGEQGVAPRTTTAFQWPKDMIQYHAVCMEGIYVDVFRQLLTNKYNTYEFFTKQELLSAVDVLLMKMHKYKIIHGNTSSSQLMFNVQTKEAFFTGPFSLTHGTFSGDVVWLMSRLLVHIPDLVKIFKFSAPITEALANSRDDPSTASSSDKTVISTPEAVNEARSRVLKDTQHKALEKFVNRILGHWNLSGDDLIFRRFKKHPLVDPDSFVIECDKEYVLKLWRLPLKDHFVAKYEIMMHKSFYEVKLTENQRMAPEIYAADVYSSVGTNESCGFLLMERLDMLASNINRIPINSAFEQMFLYFRKMCESGLAHMDCHLKNWGYSLKSGRLILTDFEYAKNNVKKNDCIYYEQEMATLGFTTNEIIEKTPSLKPVTDMLQRAVIELHTKLMPFRPSMIPPPKKLSEYKKRKSLIFRGRTTETEMEMYIKMHPFVKIDIH